MKFVSYAQNFEDVMLWRALKHVEHGLYVDIGAQHPIIDSVSKAFYEHGWRGVHVEPVAEYAELLRRDRPDETVLQVALAESEGVLELNVIAETGLSTAVGAYAERHLAEHGFAHTTVQVPMLTMKSALRWLEGRDVHWLKIDVEGLEEQVLRGWDPTVLRPWVMVIEATIPTSTETDFKGWEPLVLAAGYRFVYFDGLNRFYVADQHPELVAAFASPANVFDEARLSGMASSELCRGLLATHQEALDAGAAREGALAAERDQARADVQESLARADGVQGALDAERTVASGLQQQLDGLRRELQAEHELNGVMRQALDAEREHKAQLQAELATLREYGRLHAHIAWMQGQWDAARRQAEDLNRSSHDWYTNAQQSRGRLEDMHRSSSWRVTAPLRAAGSLVRWLLRTPGSTAQSGMAGPKRVVRVVMRSAIGHPAIKARAVRLLARAPGLEHRLRQLALRAGLTVSPALAGTVQPAMPVPPGAPMPELDERSLAELSPRAAKILAEIHKAIEDKQ